MERRSFAERIFMKPATSVSPSGVARNSETWASDGASEASAFAPGALGAFKEELDGHAENVRDLVQPAGADPVDALLVFLDLLEGEVEAFSQGGLRHAEHQAAHADARADMLIGRVGSLDRHHSTIPLAGASRILGGRQTNAAACGSSNADGAQAYRREL